MSSPARRAALALTTIAALYVVLLLSLFRPCGGLQGRYLVAGQGGVEALVHERVDPQIDFSVPQKLDAAYVFHWNQSRLGDFPRDWPEEISARHTDPFVRPQRGVTLVEDGD